MHRDLKPENFLFENKDDDSQIKIMGKLLDFSTEEEVEKYYGSKIIRTENVDVVNTENDESNYII